MEYNQNMEDYLYNIYFAETINKMFKKLFSDETLVGTKLVWVLA